jgi:hypothetical protein
MNNNLRYFLLAISLFAFYVSKGQNAISPYSAFGIGELQSSAYIQNIGMGETGVSYPSVLRINQLNPALLPFNYYTTFELGLKGDYLHAKATEAEDKDASGRINYLAFVFPLAKKYSVSAGLQPVSQMYFKYTTVSQIPNTNSFVAYDESGSGGLNKVFLSQGYQLLRFKNKSQNKSVQDTTWGFVNIGLKAEYIFGAIERSSASTILLLNSQETVERQEKTNHKGFVLSPGVALRFNVNRKKDYYLNLGATYGLQTRINTSSLILSQRRTVAGGIIYSDTVDANRRGNFVFPSSFRFGGSFERSSKWALAAEVSGQNWSEYKQEDFKNRITYHIGGEYTPDYTSNGYLKRVTYRTGFNFTNSQIFVKNHQVKEFGINFGISLPMSGNNFNFNTVNLAFTTGKRGTLTDGLILEKFYNIHLGVTLSDRTWFIRRKYD